MFKHTYGDVNVAVRDEFNDEVMIKGKSYKAHPRFVDAILNNKLKETMLYFINNAEDARIKEQLLSNTDKLELEYKPENSECIFVINDSEVSICVARYFISYKDYVKDRIKQKDNRLIMSKENTINDFKGKPIIGKFEHDGQDTVLYKGDKYKVNKYFIATIRRYGLREAMEIFAEEFSKELFEDKDRLELDFLIGENDKNISFVIHNRNVAIVLMTYDQNIYKDVYRNIRRADYDNHLIERGDIIGNPRKKVIEIDASGARVDGNYLKESTYNAIRLALRMEGIHV